MSLLTDFCSAGDPCDSMEIQVGLQQNVHYHEWDGSKTQKKLIKKQTKKQQQKTKKTKTK